MRLTVKLAACALLGAVGVIVFVAWTLPRSIITARSEGR